MAKRHLFSLNAPANWPIERKKNVWVTRPNPGPHPFNKCIPLSILIKNLLGYGRTLREIKTILNSGEIVVDNRIRKDYKFPVGLMDGIKIKKTNENFRLIINKNNKYELKKINDEELKFKPCKIINKKILKKGKVQLNLYGGRNIIVEKDSYNVGDTLLIDTEKNNIQDHLKLSKGSTVYIDDGKYIGTIGKISEIIVEKSLAKNKILIAKDKEKIYTLKDYAFVIPEDMFKK